MQLELNKLKWSRKFWDFRNTDDELQLRRKIKDENSYAAMCLISRCNGYIFRIMLSHAKCDIEVTQSRQDSFNPIQTWGKGMLLFVNYSSYHSQMETLDEHKHNISIPNT